MTNNLCILLPMIVLLLTSHFLQAQKKRPVFSKIEIAADLDYLLRQLEQHSAYAQLNRIDYRKQVDAYQAQLTDSTKLENIGLFLTTMIGQLGDRHASVRGYDLPDERFLPFVVAPYEGKVVALKFNRSTQSYNYLHIEFPYLTAINNLTVKKLLSTILPEEVGAPIAAYHYRAVKQLRHLEESFAIVEKELPEQSTFTFSGSRGDTTIEISVLPYRKRFSRWRDQMGYRQPSEEELNDTTIIAQQFKNFDDIAYLRLSDMVAPDEAPNFYEAIPLFLRENQDSRALIIDIRNNSGGTRDLMMLLSQYLVHSDSIYVANVAYQRGDSLLNKEQQQSLTARYLQSMNQLDKKEKQIARQFLIHFQPKATFDSTPFSEPHFLLFNGQKKKSDAQVYHYDRPVYVLMNERSFSAASILAAAFDVLPNVQLVGETTDGSSGNSQRFRLPNTGLRIRLSTMLSFQTDGQLLDGHGTTPDIPLSRTIDQVHWKRDEQLEELLAYISRTP